MYGFSIKLMRAAALFLGASVPVQASAQAIQTPVTPSNNASIAIQRGGYFHSGDNRFQLRLEQDGNMRLMFGSQVLWQSNTGPKYSQVPGATFVTQGCIAQFQADGNLVVYGAEGVVGAIHPCLNPNNTLENMGAMWSSKTHGNPGSKFDVQNDGNVVITNASGRAIWSTKTCCR